MSPFTKGALKMLHLMFHLLILVVLILDIVAGSVSVVLISHFFFFASYAILFTQSDSEDGLKL